jgi:hypothetical protein
MKQLFFIIALMLSSISMGAQTKNNEMKYNKIQVEDCRVFGGSQGILAEPYRRTPPAVLIGLRP